MTKKKKTKTRKKRTKGMIVIGLTGSIAMGKSKAASMLAQMDSVAVFDSDDMVHKLYKNPEVVARVRDAFPASYDAGEGIVDRKKLLAELGHDHGKWDELEHIVHPYVQELQQKFIAQHRALGTKIVVLDIPLLFETGAQNRVDYTICISASERTQRARIDERIRNGKITEESFQFRHSRQMPDVEKRKLANFVVSSELGLAYTRAALETIIRDLKERHFGNGHEHSRLPSYKL